MNRRRDAGDGVGAARSRGEDYLLDRKLARSLSTGELINPNWSLFSYPPGHHYDVLRGLDYLRKAGVAPDDRVAEAVELVKGKQTPDGRWLLENPHRDLADFHMEAAGEPSHWNTLRALRVLKWAGSAVEG